MYLSRYHFSNGLISVAIDSLTGELLELVNEKTGENLIKNSAFVLKQPFQLFAVSGTKEVRLFGGNASLISKGPDLKPTITSEELAGNGVKITITYPKLTDGEKSYNTAVEYSVEIPAGRAETLWQMKLTNNELDLLVKDIRFPCLNGIYFGDKWEDNTLVYPYLAGIKVKNPVGAFEEPKQIIYWKWQEYKYSYVINNLASGPDNDGLYVLDCNYSGKLSMTWLDYYGDGQGLYFANHDPVSRVISLRAETFGTKSPGMNFCFVHHPYIEYGKVWMSSELVAAIHDGDWHRGAELYRAFREEHGCALPERPKWFEKSPGLMAHYDFKYQNGGIVHRYKDIPGLLDEAQQLGINHLLFAGWHHDGFDHGFPEYYPDEEMGSEEELKVGIREIIKKGGHVSFYINTRLHNLKYDRGDNFIADNAVIQQDGKPRIERYGDGDIQFASMCINSTAWPAHMKNILRNVTENIGVEGVYLDQLSMAPACICHNKNHIHSYDCWNRGYQSLLEGVIQRREQISPDRPMSIIHEGVSDAYGGYSSGQLISTFFYFFCSYPELYKYTYPEQILVDMVYPQKNMAMRPVYIGQASTKMINKAFVTGSYFWIYDLIDDNTFTRDPEQYRYLQNVIALRKYWLNKFGHGVFRDTEGVIDTQHIMTKRFDIADGILLACAREELSAEKVFVSTLCKRPKTVQVVTANEGHVTSAEAAFLLQNGVLQVELPDSVVSLVWIALNKDKGENKNMSGEQQ